MTPAALTNALGIDVGRLRAERLQRLRDNMTAQGVGALVLTHAPHVGYATGHGVPAADASMGNVRRAVAVIRADGDRPHLVGGEPDGLDVIAHPGSTPDTDDGARALAAVLDDVLGDLSPEHVAVDGWTGPMLRAGTPTLVGSADARPVITAATICKTADELACISAAQRINEEAMLDVVAGLAPGVHRSDLAATFLRRIRELGIDRSMIDPIFQPMPRSVADGPRTTTGDVAFPTGLGDPAYSEGDLVWVDSGITVHGYASDFGRTWICGRGPNEAEQELFDRWRAVIDASLAALRPGATSGDLCRAATAANGGERPWLPHFYLAHGLGIESAEMPLIGTDLGEEFDDAFVLAPGMVVVLEPVIWVDGVGSYRAEEVIAVTDDGWRALGGEHPYDPFVVR
ncbi:MAG: aminopeptidase P family protein [Actinobacteria bacterium]|nr:aminopeptidase P family protein [Actinomycetota bacterium]